MRKISFNAGPAMLPLPVMEQAQRELLDFDGTGLSILEHSHRGKEYEGVHEEALGLFAELMYGTLDRLRDFYTAPVEKADRSLMNAVFRLETPELDEAFLRAAAKRGLVGMKGHRAAGGMRVSLYNAISLDDVKALTGFMADFARRKG